MKGKNGTALTLVLAIAMTLAFISISAVDADADTTVVTTFAEFKSAMESSGEGSIQLGNDFDMNNGVTVAGTKTLDLNGKAIQSTRTLDVGNNSDSVSLTINDSVGGGSITRTSGNSILTTKGNGSLIINAGTYGSPYPITATKTASAPQYSIVINGGTFNAQYDTVWCTGEGTVTINGGTFNSSGKTNVFIDGTQGAGGPDITITGGTFTTSFNNNLFLTQPGTMKILGGTYNIQGSASIPGINIIVRCGNVTVDLDSIETSNTCTGTDMDGRQYGSSTFFTDAHLIGAYYTDNQYGYGAGGTTDVSLTYIFEGKTTVLDSATIADKYVTSSRTAETEKFTFQHVKKKVTFDSNGGSPVEPQTVMYNSKASEPDNPTKEKCEFISWNLGGSPFDFDKQIKSDITLKAVWREYSYTVVYDANGGHGGPEKMVVGLTESFDLPKVHKFDAALKGWCMDPEGIGTLYKKSAVSLSDTDGATVVLYAIWNPIPEDDDDIIDIINRPQATQSSDENHNWLVIAIGSVAAAVSACLVIAVFRRRNRIQWEPAPAGSSFSYNRVMARTPPSPVPV